MNMTQQAIVLACGLSVGFSVSTTLAQVAPPPTKPANEVPEYTPPAEEKPVVQPSAQPTEPAKKPAVNVKKNRGDIQDLPIDVPYPKLAQPGPDGKLLRLRQLPDIAALRSNPNVGPKTAEKIMPIIYSRRYRFENMVIDNLDLYWALTGGMIDNMKLTDLDGMGQIAEMLKPLVGKTSLSQELQNRGILTRVQGGMNEYIVREYKKMITDEIQVLSADGGLEEVMKFVLNDSLQETKITYLALLAEAIPQISTIIDEAGLSSDASAALALLEKPLNADPEQQFVDLQEFEAAFRALSVDEAMSILSAIRQSRKNPDISPMVAPLEVLHERKQVMKSGFELEQVKNNGKDVDLSKIKGRDAPGANEDQPAETEN